MSSRKISFESASEGAGYVRLPGHTGDVRGGKQTWLWELIGEYPGPDVLFDFDKTGRLVGVEILCDDDDDPEGEDASE